MAKDLQKESLALVEALDQEFKPAFPGHGDPLPEAGGARGAVPTEAQHDWLRKNPRYMRTSHAYHKFVERGTLYPDGTFVPVSKHPVTDGNGAFGVGIPLGR